MSIELKGIHHLTAVSAKIRDNHHFYTGTMGMRLVKRSVNQDDVSAYHLFYADAKGTPGTDLTFFDWPVPTESRGSRAISRTSLRVAGADSLAYWTTRLGELGSLVDDRGAGESNPWDRSPVPAEHQIRGLGPIALSVPTLAPTDALLRAIGMRPVREYAHPENAGDVVHVYEMGPGGVGAELHVAEQRSLKPARPGAGGVHHVAFRSNDADYDAWAEKLNTLGIPNSGKVDRFWFRSLYFREPNGILFEIATDGPGFGVDEDQSTLGEKVVLAPFLEPQREKIVANLKPID